MAEREVERRLTAIVSADVVGYTRLMEADEVGTHARLKARYTELVEPQIAERGGRVVKLMGDGLLAEFPSVVDAVKWAVEMQAKVAELNAETPDVQQIEYRVGVNLGDVIVDGEDIYGDGVNVAARLQEIAERGGVCISEKVQTEVRGKLAVEFEDGGAQVVKNVTDPVRVWRWSPSRVEASGTVAPTQAGEPLPLPDKPSIAVLAFNNMSGDPEQEYFSDGITEDIITELSRFRELFVIARNSSFAFKGEALDIKQIAQQLGVQYVVEGSVRRAGNRVRISAQLIDGISGNHLWANRYDRDLEDIFAVQDEVCETVVGTLAGRLVEIGADRATRKGTESLSAYDYLIQGRAHQYRYTQSDIEEARAMFQRALSLDPSYAAAYAGVAYTYWADWFCGWANNPDECFELGIKAAENAVSLDDADSQTEMAKGLLHLFCREFDEARVHFDKAIALNPNEPDAYMYEGWRRMFSGNPEDALEQLDRAQRLNPFGRYGYVIAMINYSAKRYEDAIAALKTVRLRNPAVHAWLAASYAQLERSEEAKAASAQFVAVGEAGMQKVGASPPDSWLLWFANRHPYTRRADLEHVLEGLRKAGLSE